MYIFSLHIMTKLGVLRDLLPVIENNIEPNTILTPSLSLESGSEEYRAPNLLQRVISLLKNVGPGSDLTCFQLPPLFNLPKSQLQCFGESVYCVGDNMLRKCAEGKSLLERLAAVVGWSISTTRPLIFGFAPFNPILGETHHVSRGSLNVMLEQVLHHPPVTALHATDEKNNVETIWCHNTIPKFYGNTQISNNKKGTKLSSCTHILHDVEKFLLGAENTLKLQGQPQIKGYGGTNGGFSIQFHNSEIFQKHLWLNFIRH